MLSLKNDLAAFKSNPNQLKCPETGRPAVAILTKATPKQQTLFCVKCLVDKFEEIIPQRSNLILLEDFFSMLERQIEMKEGTKDIISEEKVVSSISAISQSVKAAIHSEIDKSYSQHVESAENEMRQYCQLVIKGQPESVISEGQIPLILKSELWEAPHSLPPSMRALVQFYLENMIDRKMLLSETLEEANNNIYELDVSTKKAVERLVKNLLVKEMSSLLFANKFIKKLNPEMDIIKRMSSIQPLYAYAQNGNLSLSFKVSRPAVFYGFNNYQSNVETRVRYTLSRGEAKNLLDVILAWDSTLRDPQQAIVITDQQTNQTSAEMLEKPIQLEAEVWYNITMNPNENRNINMYWGNGTNIGGGNTQILTNQNQTEVHFKNGTDDNCGNGTYAHIFPDFFIS